jgi:hypothetical protein
MLLCFKNVGFCCFRKGCEDEDRVVLFEPHLLSLVPLGSSQEMGNTLDEDKGEKQQTRSLSSEIDTWKAAVRGKKRRKRPPTDPLTVIPSKTFRLMMDSASETLTDIETLFHCFSSCPLTDVINQRHCMLFSLSCCQLSCIYQTL